MRWLEQLREAVADWHYTAGGSWAAADAAELNGATWLGLGLSYCIANGWALDLALIEDLMGNSTTDVGFQLALRYMPRFTDVAARD